MDIKRKNPGVLLLVEVGYKYRFFGLLAQHAGLDMYLFVSRQGRRNRRKRAEHYVFSRSHLLDCKHTNTAPVHSPSASCRSRPQGTPCTYSVTALPHPYHMHRSGLLGKRKQRRLRNQAKPNPQSLRGSSLRCTPRLVNVVLDDHRWLKACISRR